MDTESIDSIINRFPLSTSRLRICKRRNYSHHCGEYCDDSVEMECVPVMPDLSRFTNLLSIYCVGIKLERFDMETLTETLEHLVCSKNQIVELPKLPRKLRRMVCDNNRIQKLPELPDSIQTINVDNNRLIEIASFPLDLIRITAKNNRIYILPEKINGRLVTLSLSDNLLTELPELPSTLMYLHVSNNHLKRLPEIKHTQLVQLNCSNNHIEEIPELNSALMELDFANNRVKRCPRLHANIIMLVCSNNTLETPPILVDGIQILQMDQNLKLDRLPVLVNTLRAVSFTHCPMIQHIPDIHNIEHITKLNGYMSGVRTCNYITPVYLTMNFNINHTPLADIVVNTNASVDHSMQSLYRFRLAFYSAKYRATFRRWLWERVRMPKIAEQYSPRNLLLRLNTIQDEEDAAEFDAVLNTW